MLFNVIFWTPNVNIVEMDVEFGMLNIEWKGAANARKKCPVR